MFELKPDFEEVLARYEAWWNAAVLDRPLVNVTCAKPMGERLAPPVSDHASLRDRWLDTEYQVAAAVAQVSNLVYLGDTVPRVYPNLGPEVFSAFYGCPLEFGDTTSWSVPILKDWRPESMAALQLDRNNFYFRKILELTDAYIEAARGRFIVGYTDLHPGGDAIAAFRDPQELCVDMIEHPAEVKALCERVTDEFLEIFDLFYDRLSAAGMPSTGFIPAVCSGRMHIPSNDFSCMISESMFEEIFLPGIVRECRHMTRSVYHLDGPGALRFLDMLLAVPEIHAIQWVAGAGQDYWANWIDVYQRIQAAGKAMIVYVPMGDLNRCFEVLRPEGVCLTTWAGNVEEAEAVVKAVARWR